MAKNGNDSFSGKLAVPNSNNTDGPFLTLTKAQSAMQGSTIKNVYILSGTYSIGSLTLNYLDDNEAWVGYPGQSAVLDGAGTGQISVSGATGVVMENLTIQNVSNGIYMNPGGQNFKIRWNTFLNCTQACVWGSNSSNNTVDSNTFNGGGSGTGPGGSGSPGTFYAAIFSTKIAAAIKLPTTPSKAFRDLEYRLRQLNPRLIKII